MYFIIRKIVNTFLKLGREIHIWRHQKYKVIQSNVHPKGNQSWIFIGRTDAGDETLILWHLMWRTDSLEKTWCWESLRVGVEGNDRGWDGWMVGLNQWTWVWVSSRSWWWTGRPGVLQFVGLQSWTWLSTWTDWTESSIFVHVTAFILCRELCEGSHQCTIYLIWNLDKNFWRSIEL